MSRPFALLLSVLLCAAPLAGARADNELPYNPVNKWPSWQEYKQYNPYLERGKDTQNQQWADEDWYVQDWVAQSASPKALVDGFFRADILREQTMRDGVPTIIVGPQFYRLGGFDKRRVITSVDAVYGITDGGQAILLHDWRTKRQIGVFTREGLQLE
jgi:hypothetical protein